MVRTWPHENYQDRKTSSLIGIYELYQSLSLIRPKETMNKWVLYQYNGNGIIIQASKQRFGIRQKNEDFDGGNDKSQDIHDL